ncbi:MAG: PfkB family carbohydrate kinase, partial [Acetobacteraceae bacterium]
MILAQPSPSSVADPAAVRLLSKASALVIGDVVLDRSVFGTPAAGQVLREDRETALAGGAGNLVRHLTALGAATAFIAVVGDDQAGSELTALIGGQPNVEPWLLVEGGRRTAVRTRYLAAGRLLLQAERTPAEPVDARLAERILRIARDSMAATSVTVLSDRGNSLFTPELAGQLVAAAKAAGRRVVA